MIILTVHQARRLGGQIRLPIYVDDLSAVLARDMPG